MRTFVAIPIPREGPAPRFLEACQGRLKQAGGDVRWTRPEQWHITLRFIGETTDAVRLRLEDVIRETAAMYEPLEIRLDGWGVFPENGRPRVVWAGAEAPDITEMPYGRHYEWPRSLDLQYSIEQAARAVGVPMRRDDYFPHVTLARTKPPKDIGPLLNILRNEPPPPGAAFTATHITLFQSVLSPEGSTYTPLLEAPLGLIR
jgi:2'-5' RNA ligase